MRIEGKKQKDGDYAYTVYGGLVTILGYRGTGGAAAIPAALGGYPTVSIGVNAFNNAKGHLVTSVEIPEGITSIGYQAFCACTALTSVTIPNSVTSIGEAAFLGCSALNSLVIGNGVTVIGKATFCSCTSLTSVIIPENVTSIGYQAFCACTALKSVVLGSGVTDMGMRAFADCTALTSITFLGLVAPTSVLGGWIDNTSTEIRGHASQASNFPPPGSSFGGLMMDTVVSAIDSAHTHSAPSSPPLSEQPNLTSARRTKMDDPARCPNCLAPISASPLCGRCGYNLRRRTRLGTVKFWILIALIITGMALWFIGHVLYWW